VIVSEEQMWTYMCDDFDVRSELNLESSGIMRIQANPRPHSPDCPRVLSGTEYRSLGCEILPPT